MKRSPETEGFNWFWDLTGFMVSPWEQLSGNLACCTDALMCSSWGLAHKQKKEEILKHKYSKTKAGFQYNYDGG